MDVKIQRNSLYFFPHKNKGIPFTFPKLLRKKNLRNFLTKKKIDFFFDFFPKDVVFTLLRGPKTIRKM